MLRKPVSVSASNLTYATENDVLIDSISVEFSPHGLTVVMGPNGAGKSLLLRLIGGLIEPNAGSVSVQNGQADRPARLALMAQRPVLLRRSVQANLDFALKVHGVPANERGNRIRELLSMVGMLALSKRPARLLSGGEQQRLSLARALAMEPDILLLDEPTANLDPNATAQIEDVVRQAVVSGVKVIFVTHNRDQARRLADEVVFLHRGRLVEQSPADTFFNDPATQQAADFLSGNLLV